jgi:hypothetical protein
VIAGRDEVARANPRHATSTLSYHSCHSDAERGGGICDSTSPEKWRDCAEKQVRSPLPPVHDFQPHPASTQPQPCFIILVIPTPNAAEESATARHPKNGEIAQKSRFVHPCRQFMIFSPTRRARNLNPVLSFLSFRRRTRRRNLRHHVTRKAVSHLRHASMTAQPLA